MTSTVTFSIDYHSTPKARGFEPNDIEWGLYDEAGVQADVLQGSAAFKIVVQAAFAKDALDWLKDAGLI